MIARKLWVLLVLAFDAQAVVSLTGTRLILAGEDREVSIQAQNRGQQEVLLYSWLSEPGPPGVTDLPPQMRGDLPFVVTPPLSRLAPGARQTLRVLYQGSGMPGDRESLLHLYALHVPKRRDGPNQVNIAVRQRLNVFYRPPGLAGDPAQAAAALSWALVAGDGGTTWLQVRNPTVFHVSLQAVQLDGHVLGDQLLVPGSDARWPLPQAVAASERLAFQALTDYGGQRGYCAAVNAQAPFNARLLGSHPVQEPC